MKIIFGRYHIKAFAMLNCEDLEFSLKGVSMAAWQITLFRHGNRSCCNSAIKCPICPKLHRFDKSPGLKTSKGQYCIIIIAPPFGNRICHALYNSNILCSICTKLHMFDKCAGLKTSTCQYPVIVIAPPAGSRKFGTYKWLWHIPPIFITLNAYCSRSLFSWSHRWRWARVRGPVHRCLQL